MTEGNGVPAGSPHPCLTCPSRGQAMTESREEMVLGAPPLSLEP